MIGPLNIFIAFPIISLIPLYLAIRLRDWRFALLATLLPLPLTVLYAIPLIITAWELAGTIALRWMLGLMGWLVLLLLATGMWVIGVFGPIFLDWPIEIYDLFLVALAASLCFLLRSRPPWHVGGGEMRS